MYSLKDDDIIGFEAIENMLKLAMKQCSAQPHTESKQNHMLFEGNDVTLQECCDPGWFLLYMPF